MRIKTILLAVSAALILTACGEEAKDTKETAPKVTVSTEKAAVKPKEVAKPAPVERDAEIRKAAEKFIEKYSGSKIVKIEVNENIGANDGSYLVLAHMNYARANSVEKSRGFVTKYSEDLAANLAEVADVSDVIVFWEVPRHLEGSNAAKFTYKRADNGMVLDDEFIAPELR